MIRAMTASEHDPAPALRVEGVGYSFGAGFALEEIDFVLEPGVFTVLLGPKGAGKTTLFSLITRLFDSRQGRIEVEGHDLRRHSTKALTAMGVVFQAPTLDLDLSVMQNLLYHAALHGLPRKAGRARAEAELDRLEMLGRQDEKVRRLNGGHLRRVDVARALLHEKRLLLLDEPTVGLDVPTREALVAHVHALARDDGIAVLWATHLIDEVAEDDRVIVLHEGRIRAAGERAAVIGGTGAEDLRAAFALLTAAA